MTETISFQGELGAYSHQACRQRYPHMTALPCRTFEDAIEAVQTGAAKLAMLPIENSTYGRVADIHMLLPDAGLHIIDETYVRVRIALMAQPNTSLSDITHAISHTVLLGQCRSFLHKHNIHRVIGADTAGAAKSVAEGDAPHMGALASRLAAEIYGLDILAEDIEDQGNNTTRFVVMSKTPAQRMPDQMIKTSFVFEVRNIPAALFKALGGFATSGVNMTKLESYMVGGSFTATQFYAEIDGDVTDPPVAQALEELGYFTSHIKILGSYPKANPAQTAEPISH